MTERTTPGNLLRQRRTAQGLTQAELAARAGVSRTAVTAIEGRRLIPSVAAALALANALETSVEALFGRGLPADDAPAWVGPPPPAKHPYWAAEVAGRTWLYPADAAGMLAPLPDGVASAAARATVPVDQAGRTLVVAGCDPAAGLLASAFAEATGMRMLCMPRSSRQALELLKQGQVHVAGLHLSTEDQPERNAAVVRELLGGGYELLRIASWQEGIATATVVKTRSLRGLVAGRLRWVGREPGSGARQCFDRLVGDRVRPRHVARDHRAVAEAVASGWADAGVCVELAGREAGLNFLPLVREPYDLCIPLSLATDPRIQALKRTVRSAAYRALLASLPGYTTTATGELQPVLG